ncbi:hypothetical protein SLS60_012101 [Paraconiothyrium brasiliense]|uniref:Uncharacterized protein n=1 Tax=Paraconiothyrium brasiliense TaxID=300254 RepID=A0ABR3QH86_9PLEO
MTTSFKDWLARIEPDTRSRTLERFTEDGKWSASTIPVQAFLQFHLLQDRESKPLGAFDSVREEVIVAQDDAEDVAYLIASSPYVDQLDDLLKSFSLIFDGDGTPPTPPEPFNMFIATLMAFEKLKNTPYDESYTPTIMDAPRAQKFVRRNVPPPVYPDAKTPPRPAPQVSHPSPILRDTSWTTRMLGQLQLVDTPTRSTSGSSHPGPPNPIQGPIRLTRANSRTLAEEETPFSGAPQQPSNTETGLSTMPSTPPHATASDDVPNQHAQLPETLKGRTAYEVQTSIFFDSYLKLLAIAEKGYFFGDVDNPIFQARPDGVFEYKNEAGDMAPRASFELKPVRRGIQRGREKIRLEEGSQFVAMLSHDGKVKHDEELKRSLETQPFESLPKTSHVNQDPDTAHKTQKGQGAPIPSPRKDKSRPIMRETVRTVDDEQKDTQRIRIAFALNHNEFYIVVTTYKASYEAQEEMEQFNIAFTGIVLYELRKTEKGRGFLKDLLNERRQQRAYLSPEETAHCERYLSSNLVEDYGRTEEGRAKLRHLVASIKAKRRPSEGAS